MLYYELVYNSIMLTNRGRYILCLIASCLRMPSYINISMFYIYILKCLLKMIYIYIYIHIHIYIYPLKVVCGTYTYRVVCGTSSFQLSNKIHI